MLNLSHSERRIKHQSNVAIQPHLENYSCRLHSWSRSSYPALIDADTIISGERRHIYSGCAGKEKVIYTHLPSGTRAAFADLQGVNSSLYSKISPLHLPEVLAFVSHYHGQTELYVALKSSIAGVISSIVNRKHSLPQCQSS